MGLVMPNNNGQRGRLKNVDISVSKVLRIT